MSNLQLLDRKTTASPKCAVESTGRPVFNVSDSILGPLDLHDEIWGSLSICSWQSSKEGAFRNLLCQRRLPNSYPVYLRFTRKLWAHLAIWLEKHDKQLGPPKSDTEHIQAMIASYYVRSLLLFVPFLSISRVFQGCLRMVRRTHSGIMIRQWI